MDHSNRQQQIDHHGYHHQEQHQQQQAAYDQSQIQPYNAYNQPYEQQQHQSSQYQYYPHQNYAYMYPQHQYQQESALIHPPGVPVPSEPQNQQNVYYPQAVVENQQQVYPGSDSTAAGGFNPAAASAAVAFSQLTEFAGNMDAAQRAMHPPIGQSPYRGGGRRGGRPFRGGGRGVRPDGVASSFRGRGRGQGGSRQFLPHGAASTPAVAGQGPAAPIWPPPRMAWCELCRVDCNTPEILEQHKNGKRHKKNLQVHGELQNLNKVITGQQNTQIPSSEFKTEGVQPLKFEGCEQPPLEKSSSEAVPDNSNETEQQKDSAEKSEETVAELEAERKQRDRFELRGRGKRKMRGGRGGKYMRTNEGPRRPVEPPKPKEMVIPWMCELCNVKCESQVVFDTHLAGKKHQSNLKRFHGHRELYGEAGLQALYPPNMNASSTSSIPQVQQAIYDPQVLLAQLLNYVLAQAQAPAPAGAPGPSAAWAPLPLPGPGFEIQYHQNLHNQSSHPISVTENQQPIATNLQAPTPISTNSITEHGTSEAKSKEVNLPPDTSVVAPSENPITEIEQGISASVTTKSTPVTVSETALQPQHENQTEMQESKNTEANK